MRPFDTASLINIALDSDKIQFHSHEPHLGHLNNINLGAGNKIIEGCEPFDLPNWDARTGKISWPNNTVHNIYAFHFFEHLDAENAIQILKECERILVPRGILHIACPHAMSELHHQDIMHKSQWHEDTLRILLYNEDYDPTGHRWKLGIKSRFIAGTSYRNLMVFYQLEKEI